MVTVALNRPTGEGAVLGVIFAGGASRRYGQDKALARLHGVSLLQRVADRLGPQVDALAISGQPRPDLPVPNIPDRLEGAGPLAALCSVLRLAEQRGWPLVATISCDTPFIPDNFVSRLGAALKNYDCAVAGRNGVQHPTCALWATRACAGVEAAFNAGARSLCGAIAHLDAIEVDFSAVEDGPGGDPFFNINFQHDMAAAQAWQIGTHGSK